MSLSVVLKKNWKFLNWFWFKPAWMLQKTFSDDEVTLLINHFGLDVTLRLLKKKQISDKSILMLKAFQQDLGLLVTKPKRIAVCMSGDLRSIENCNQSIQRFFKGHEVTYFCHSWDDSESKPCFGDAAALFIKEERRPDLTDLERKSIESFGLKVYNPEKKVPYMSPNLFPMWYGVKQAFHMIEENGFEHNAFDLIARCRYDNYFLGQLEQYQGVWVNNKVVIDLNYNGYGGYGDQFAIGMPKVMETYCSVFDWFDTAFDKLNGKNQFFAEVVLKEYLRLVDVEVEQVNFGLRLLREEFIGLAGDKIPLRSHITSKNRNESISLYVKDKFPELFDMH